MEVTAVDFIDFYIQLNFGFIVVNHKYLSGVEQMNRHLTNELFAFKKLHTEEFTEKAVLCLID